MRVVGRQHGQAEVLIGAEYCRDGHEKNESREENRDETLARLSVERLMYAFKAPCEVTKTPPNSLECNTLKDFECCRNGKHSNGYPPLRGRASVVVERSP